MISFILRRLLQLIPVLLGISLVVFLIMSLLPGDPAPALRVGGDLVLTNGGVLAVYAAPTNGAPGGAGAAVTESGPTDRS